MQGLIICMLEMRIIRKQENPVVPRSTILLLDSGINSMSDWLLIICEEEKNTLYWIVCFLWMKKKKTVKKNYSVG